MKHLSLFYQEQHISFGFESLWFTMCVCGNLKWEDYLKEFAHNFLSILLRTNNLIESDDLFGRSE